MDEESRPEERAAGEPRRDSVLRHARRTWLYAWAGALVALLVILIALVAANTRTVKHATDGNRRQRFSLISAVSGGGALAAECHRLQPRGSTKAPSARRASPDARQPAPGRTRPDSYATITACVRSRRSSFLRIRATCVLTVCSLAGALRAQFARRCAARRCHFPSSCCHRGSERNAAKSSPSDASCRTRGGPSASAFARCSKAAPMFPVSASKQAAL